MEGWVCLGWLDSAVKSGQYHKISCMCTAYRRAHVGVLDAIYAFMLMNELLYNEQRRMVNDDVTSRCDKGD